jgi:hypothetical protein
MQYCLNALAVGGGETLVFDPISGVQRGLLSTLGTQQFGLVLQLYMLEDV